MKQPPLERKPRGKVPAPPPYKSHEEHEFSKWLRELNAHGYIRYFKYEPRSFVLYEGNKELKLRPHVYTPDFQVKWNTEKEVPEALKKYVCEWYEVKGEFCKHEGLRSFSINRKWVHYMYDKYVALVKVPSVFEATFFPQTLLDNPKKYKKYTKKSIWEFCNVTK